MLFSPGQCQLTPAAAEFLASQQVAPEELLARHLTGDWGKQGQHNEILPTLTPDEKKYGRIACTEDSHSNCISVLQGSGLVMSIYPFGEEVVWILSKLRPSNSTTTVMMPSDY